jgi:hypothetical protein
VSGAIKAVRADVADFYRGKNLQIFDGKAVEQALSRIYATPPDLVERVKAIIGERP